MLLISDWLASAANPFAHMTCAEQSLFEVEVGKDGRCRKEIATIFLAAHVLLGHHTVRSRMKGKSKGLLGLEILKQLHKS